MISEFKNLNFFKNPKKPVILNFWNLLSLKKIEVPALLSSSPTTIPS